MFQKKCKGKKGKTKIKNYKRMKIRENNSGKKQSVEKGEKNLSNFYFLKEIKTTNLISLQ